MPGQTRGATAADSSACSTRALHRVHRVGLLRSMRCSPCGESGTLPGWAQRTAPFRTARLLLCTMHCMQACGSPGPAAKLRPPACRLAPGARLCRRRLGKPPWPPLARRPACTLARPIPCIEVSPICTKACALAAQLDQAQHSTARKGRCSARHRPLAAGIGLGHEQGEPRRLAVRAGQSGAIRKLQALSRPALAAPRSCRSLTPSTMAEPTFLFTSGECSGAAAPSMPACRAPASRAWGPRGGPQADARPMAGRERAPAPAAAAAAGGWHGAFRLAARSVPPPTRCCCPDRRCLCVPNLPCRVGQ